MVGVTVADWFDLLPEGRVQTLSFPRSTTSYELTGLQPSTDYIITLYTLYEGREVATPVSTAPRGNQLQTDQFLALMRFAGLAFIQMFSSMF